MNNYQFISYTPTPGEKHLGIAAITYHQKLILRYKVMPTKDGTNFFPVPAAYKVGESYQAAFMLDSNIEKEEIENLVKSGVRKALQSSTSFANPGKLIESIPGKVVEANFDGMPF